MNLRLESLFLTHSPPHSARMNCGRSSQDIFIKLARAQPGNLKPPYVRTLAYLT